MASPPISRLHGGERQALLDDLRYLNMAEIEWFCKRHSIPYAIVVETEGQRAKATKDKDRKGVILGRIRHFLQTGVILAATHFPRATVCYDPLPERLAANDRLFYGQYDKTSPAMAGLLERLTAGKFRDGAIARTLARDFWTQGEAPTFRQYAMAWLQASREHVKPNAEWAFLSDKSNKTAGRDWKKLRAAKAARVMEVLNRIVTGSDIGVKRPSGR